MADKFEIGLRKKQASQDFVLTRLDHQQIGAGTAHLAQNALMNSDAGLYARINDNPIAPQPVRCAIEATAILYRLETRKVFGLLRVQESWVR